MFKQKDSDKEVADTADKIPISPVKETKETKETNETKEPKVKNLGEIITMLRNKHLKSKILSKQLFTQFDSNVRL